MSVVLDGGPFLCTRSSGLYEEIQLLDDQGQPIPLTDCTLYLDIADDPAPDTEPTFRINSAAPTANGSEIEITDEDLGKFTVRIDEDDALNTTAFRPCTPVERFRRFIDTGVVIRASNGDDLLGAPVPFPIVFKEEETRP